MGCGGGCLLFCCCCLGFLYLRVIESVNTQPVAPAAKFSRPGVPFQDPNIADRFQCQTLLGFLNKMIKRYPNKHNTLQQDKSHFFKTRGRKKKIFSPQHFPFTNTL